MQVTALAPDLVTLKVEEIKDTTDGGSAGILTGYASIFNNVDLGGDVVVPGAFAKTLKERLRPDKKGGGIPLMDSHKFYEGTGAVIGLVTDAKEDNIGLNFTARFSSTGRAQEVRTKVQEGILSAISFGFDIIKADGGEETNSGKRKPRYLREVKLYEISVVVWGMNPKAHAEAKAAGNVDTFCTLEKALSVEDYVKQLALDDDTTPATPEPGAEKVNPLLEELARGVKGYAFQARLEELRKCIRGN